MRHTRFAGIIIMLVFTLSLFAGPASAGFLDDIFDKINQFKQQPPEQQPTRDRMDEFMENLRSLNTPENIKIMDAEMGEAGYTSIQVTVTRFPFDPYTVKVFYVVKGYGIVDSWPDYEAYLPLTHSQAVRIYDIVKDGRVTFFERFQVYAIIKMG